MNKNTWIAIGKLLVALLIPLVLLPYIIWVTFATILNAAIWQLN